MIFRNLFTRISKVCSTYELTEQFMEICAKNCTIDLKKNNLYEVFYEILSIEHEVRKYLVKSSEFKIQM